MSESNSIVDLSYLNDEQEALTRLEALEGTLTENELNELESRLFLTAGVLGWTGDPLRQPPAVVLSIVEAIIGERSFPKSIRR
jgi:hypothetical protein